MGIIDDGIAFAHERFRLGANTRVEYWWLQDGAWQGPGTIWPGRELDKTAINNLLAQAAPAGVVDEDEVYRLAGLIDFQRRGHKSAAWRIAHGTHVMDLACGYDPRAGRDDRPIVCVQLPIRVTADTSGARLFPYAHHAMKYILHRADGIARASGFKHLPVVINMSYGNFAGPHDGTARLEAAMDDLVQKSKKRGVELRIVIPAGNSYLLRAHAQVSFANAAGVASLNWRILPDGRKPSYLEIWLPPSAAAPGSRLTATITSPTGQTLTIQENGAPQQWGVGPGAYGEVRYHYRPSSQRGMFLVAVNETASLMQAAALAPAGGWTVELQNQELGPNDIVHAWVQRDDSLYGFPIRGRQSYFGNGDYTLFDSEGRVEQQDDPTCFVRRASTLNAIASGAKPIVIGGFLRKEVVVAEYSSSGPVTNPYRPDALAVTEDSRVHAGLLAAGSRSGSVVAMNGTSVAAPQIARAIADDLALGGAGDRATVQGWATVHPSAPNPPSAIERSGAGGIALSPIIGVERYWD
jgi:hypothetical protein